MKFFILILLLFFGSPVAMAQNVEYEAIMQREALSLLNMVEPDKRVDLCEDLSLKAQWIMMAKQTVSEREVFDNALKKDAYAYFYAFIGATIFDAYTYPQLKDVSDMEVVFLEYKNKTHAMCMAIVDEMSSK